MSCASAGCPVGPKGPAGGGVRARCGPCIVGCLVCCSAQGLCPRPRRRPPLCGLALCEGNLIRNCPLLGGTRGDAEGKGPAGALALVVGEE